MHFADRLLDRARRLETPVCVGIDPRWEALPAELRRRARQVESVPARAAAWAYTELAKSVIEAVEPYVCAAKPQSAFFEALGADAVTVNPYLGTDAVSPFLDACDSRGRGIFVLVRTSNPSAREIQELLVLQPEDSGGGDAQPLFHRVAALVRDWGASRLGECGYSCVGAVAGATTPHALAEIRSMLPEALLLVPGYGAQGGGAGDVAAAFDSRGEGAVVNASRSIVFAKKGAMTLGELAEGAAAAARSMRDAIREAVAKYLSQ